MKNHVRGLALTESVIAVALFFIILSMGYPVFFFSLNSFGRINEEGNLRQSIAIIDETIGKSLRYAVKISSDDDPGEYDGYLKVSSHSFLKSGTSLAGGIGDVIITKIKQESSGDSERYLLVYKVIININGRKKIFENKILLNNIVSPDHILMGDEISLKENILFFKSPG